MGFLATADLHLTSRIEHEYRWQVFPFLRRHAKRKRARTIVVAGDLGNAKDCHPARLVERVVDSLQALAAPIPGIGAIRVIVLMGNHDYAEKGRPFWSFLSKLEGGHIEFISEPTATTIDGMRCLLIPHTKDWHNRAAWRQRWKILPERKGRPRPYNYIIAHQTFKGATASNGQRMKGVPLSTMNRANTGGAFVLSGDIHVPQRCGNVLYVGSPYHVNFGDGFAPRVLYCTEDGQVSIPNNGAISRHTLTVREEELDGDEWTHDLYEGDHVKVQLQIHPASVPEAAALRDQVSTRLAELGAVHFGTDIAILRESNRKAAKALEGRMSKRSALAQWRTYCVARGIDGELAELGEEMTR